MVRLQVLSGRSAGRSIVTRRFPFHIGRAASAGLRLEEPGVWERHLVLKIDPAQGIVAERPGAALATINGEPFQSAALRNGDVLELGSVRIQFALSETRQRGFRLREGLVWLLWLGVAAGQAALIRWVLVSGH